ncbi:MAG: rhomboid family intramembrane serine protease [Bacteroidetes bacterium]|nr:rhomboid family intramembrane serine protease [Bacteroidota bacterium]
MLFPIGDDQIKGGHFPIFSYGFIGLNIIIFLLQQNYADGLACSFGAIPDNIRSGDDIVNLFTSQFLHGGWMHLIGNMLFLWVFADNIEATIGNVRFLLFYLLGGAAAALTHIYLNGSTAGYCCAVCTGAIDCDTICRGSIPMIGASGAIAAVMGAYLVMFPKSRVRVFFFFLFFHVPAFVFLLFWIGQQFFSGVNSLALVESDGVAWWAHIGGFIFGAVAGLYFRSRKDWRRQAQPLSDDIDPGEFV